VVDLFVPEGEQAAVESLLQRVGRGEGPLRQENSWVDHEGRDRAISWSNACLRDASGEVAFIIAVGIDVSERKEAERRLAEAEATYRAIFENAVEGIFQSQPDGTLDRANPAMARMLGYDSPEAFLEAAPNINDVICEVPEEKVRFFALLEETGVASDFELEMTRRDGRRIWVSISARAIKDETGRIVRLDSLAEDVTERKLEEIALRQKATFDPLTNIPNRRLLRDRLEQALAHCRRVGGSGALLYIDLDKFKPINDTHGHHTGDAVLKEVAVRLERRVRRSDTLARLGGDEFAVLLSMLSSPDDAVTVARQIVDALAEPYQVGDIECRLGASIGVAVFPGDGDSADELLRKADAAMYAAKERGGAGHLLYSEGVAACPWIEEAAQGAGDGAGEGGTR